MDRQRGVIACSDKLDWDLQSKEEFYSRSIAQPAKLSYWSKGFSQDCRTLE